MKLTATDGIRISALHLKSAGENPTILYFHGNNEDLEDVREHLEAMHSRGFSVFSFDYRGYGTTPGRPTEQNLYGDASVAYDYLTSEAGVRPELLIIYGRSLGSGPAVEIAAVKPIGGLVLEGAFLSAFRAATQFKILPMDCFENLRKLPRVTAPVLVIHALKDSVIPFHHGRQLFAAANDPRMKLWLENISHAAIAKDPGEEHWATLRRFAKLIKRPA
jgi:pimeloyl-ACP methyl ester carboxylesterase